MRRTVHGSRRDAEDVERQLILDARVGNVDDPRKTVADALEAWLEHAAPDLAVTTLYNYRRIIDRDINPKLGKVKLAKLTPAMLDRFYGQLRTDLSAKTIRNVHAVLRRALKQAQRLGLDRVEPSTACDTAEGASERDPPTGA